MAGYDPKKTRATPTAPEGNGRAAVDAVLDGPPAEPEPPRAAPDQPGPAASTPAPPGPDRRLLAAGALVALLVLLLLLWRRRR